MKPSDFFLWEFFLTEMYVCDSLDIFFKMLILKAFLKISNSILIIV